MTKTPIFQMSADARLLYQAMKVVKTGDIITYEALGEAISKTVTGATPALRTAMRRCLRDDDMVFAAVRGIGLKLLDDIEVTDTFLASETCVRRKMRRSIEVMSKVRDFESLPPKKKLEHSEHMSRAASIAYLSSDAAAKKIEAAIEKIGRNELPIAETMKLFAAS